RWGASRRPPPRLPGYGPAGMVCLVRRQLSAVREGAVAHGQPAWPPLRGSLRLPGGTANALVRNPVATGRTQRGDGRWRCSAAGEGPQVAAPDTAAICVRTRRIWPDSPVRAAE